MRRFKLLLSCFIVMSFFLITGWTYAATFIVDNLGDVDDGNPYTEGDGTNTLRKCIRLANETPGADTINFSVSGTISPTSALPAITDDGTVIDASSQWIGIWPSGQPGITLDGSDAGDEVIGLWIIGAGNCHIRGLFITNFGGNGVHIEGGGQFNTVGGTGAGYRNVISGNGGFGVFIIGSGTDNNVVSGNYIGTDASGTAALGNSFHGVIIQAGAQSNTIGGTGTGEGNTIAFSGRSGVEVNGPDTDYNKISGNSMQDNGGLGIDLVDGGNDEIPPPTITSSVLTGNTLYIEGMCAGADATVEIFKADSFVSGEGMIYLGNLVADGSGNFSGDIDVTGKGLAVGDPIVVTTTHTNNNTSEFSSPAEIIGTGINGHVTDCQTGKPIRALVIAIQKPTKVRTFTDENGYYEISDLEPGVWWLIGFKRGYKLHIARVEAPTTHDFCLEPK